VLIWNASGVSGVAVQFSLTDEQLMLKELIARMVAERYAPGRRAVYRDSEAAFSEENWAHLAELGVLAAPFLPEDGGLAGSPVDIMVVMEALGRGLVVEPVLEQIVAPGRLIARAGFAQQTERWLPQIVSGRAHLALAHFEETAGYDMSHVHATARTNASGVQIDGEKAFVFGSGGAQGFIVSARQAGGAGDTKDINFYLVARDAPGLTVTPFRLVDGSAACKLTFRGASAEKLKLEWDSFDAAVDDVRLAAGAEMVGIMSAIFEATVEHVRSRRQFGAPLSSFQVIQHRLADLFVLLEQSRSQLYRAALSPPEPRARAAAIAAMKSYISTAAIEMGEQCIHLHGGMGTTDELAIGHGHKRLLVLATLFGDAEWELQRFSRLSA
jgi:alkylation response protein AidB-like acyl-CoA dehydrogenase